MAVHIGAKRRIRWIDIVSQKVGEWASTAYDSAFKVTTLWRYTNLFIIIIIIIIIIISRSAPWLIIA